MLTELSAMEGRMTATADSESFALTTTMLSNSKSGLVIHDLPRLVETSRGFGSVSFASSSNRTRLINLRLTLGIAAPRATEDRTAAPERVENFILTKIIEKNVYSTSEELRRTEDSVI